MNRRIFLCVALLGLVALGCASQSANPLGQEARGNDATYYVENHGKDGRGLEQIIAKVLRTASLRATSGPRAGKPEDVTYLVSYADNWAWDMRTYMLRMSIYGTDTRTGGVVADSEMYQTSLAAMGKTYEEIVTATTQQLLSGASIR